MTGWRNSVLKLVWASLPLFGCILSSSSALAQTPISDCAELQSMSSNLTDDYVLTANIVCAGSFFPVGDASTPFEGSLDGAGFDISGIAPVLSPGDIDNGLFGVVGTSGSLTNIQLTDVAITGGDTRTGALVGTLRGTVSNCTINIDASSEISGATVVGGVVGLNDGGTIQNCTSTGTVRALAAGGVAGGIVGTNQNGGTVTGSMSDAVVSADIFSGGIVGNNSASVTSSNGAGAIGGASSSYVGGLVGNNSGTIDQSQSSGTVSGTSLIGGLVGGNTGTVTNSSSSASVSGSTNAIGGLIGGADVGSDVQDCTATGSVTWSSSATMRIGGLIGHLRNGILRRGVANGSVTPVTPATGSYVGGLIGQQEGGTVGQSRATGDVAGDHAVGGFIGELHAGAVQNIVEEASATGGVSGQSDVGGLIGAMLSGAPARHDIRTSQATGNVVSLGGSGANFGGLIGFAVQADIQQSYADGDVTADTAVGGLVGRVDDDTTISDCFANSDVTGSTSDVGGLVGQFGGLSNETSSLITRSFALDTIIGGAETGGFAGSTTDFTRIENSFSAAVVTGTAQTGGFIGVLHPNTVLANVYWDLTASTQPDCHGGGNTPECVGVNPAGDEADYFFISSNAPIDTFNTTPAIWNFCEGLSVPHFVRENGMHRFTLSGTVVDQNSNPLRDITISLQGTPQQVVTGADGTYSLPNVGADIQCGVYQVQAVPVANTTAESCRIANVPTPISGDGNPDGSVGSVQLDLTGTCTELSDLQVVMEYRLTKRGVFRGEIAVRDSPGVTPIFFPSTCDLTLFARSTVGTGVDLSKGPIQTVFQLPFAGYTRSIQFQADMPLVDFEPDGTRPVLHMIGEFTNCGTGANTRTSVQSRYMTCGKVRRVSRQEWFTELPTALALQECVLETGDPTVDPVCTEIQAALFTKRERFKIRKQKRRARRKRRARKGFKRDR